MRILVIDDEELVRIVLDEKLRAEGCQVSFARTGKEGLDQLQTGSFDSVITDLRMPGITGTEVLQWVREHQPEVDVIVLTGHGEVEPAVQAMKAGAWDFLVKEIPFDGSQVSAAVAKLKTVRSLRLENLALRLGASGGPHPVYIGVSPVWRALMTTAEKIAPANAPVLIQGESGSGKEVVARRLHALSLRRDHPFLAINCGAIRGELLESELFGHEKGAFTGATSSKTGLIAVADGGTLFLDEISEMSGAMQVSLLRVLDRGEYRQVGGTRTLHANVRFIAASNRDLQELVLSGRFRDDLLYRINTVLLRVPPLRDRLEDIAGLTEHFVRTFSRPGLPARALSKTALARLTAYPWPGNVRELRNVLERLLLLSSDKTEPIESDELELMLPSQPDNVASALPDKPGSLEETEKRHIADVLRTQKGNKTQTARKLGIDYKTLLAKLKKYQLS
jgi:DNA-binding NtrC family response regulator